MRFLYEPAIRFTPDNQRCYDIWLPGYPLENNLAFCQARFVDIISNIDNNVTASFRRKAKENENSLGKIGVILVIFVRGK